MPREGRWGEEETQDDFIAAHVFKFRSRVARCKKTGGTMLEEVVLQQRLGISSHFSATWHSYKPAIETDV